MNYYSQPRITGDINILVGLVDRDSSELVSLFEDDFCVSAEAVADAIRFVARLLGGETMAPLCSEFGIRQVNGYKIFSRYGDCGLHGLNGRSRAPCRQANRLPHQVERTILGIKKEYPVSLSTHSLQIIPGTWFTHFRIWGAPRCPGKSVNQWMRDFGS